LFLALKYGDLSIGRVLLDKKADPTIATETKGTTPLHIAAEQGYAEMTSMLLSAGASVAAVDKEGWTALHNAAWHGHVAVIEILVSAGADVRARAKDGASAVFAALSEKHENHADVVECLLKHGADPNAAWSSAGITPLHRATYLQKEEVVAILLEHGADPSIVAEGMTAGYVAEQTNNQKIMALIVHHESRRMVISFLQELMGKLGYGAPAVNGRLDDPTRNALSANGIDLPANGADPLTKELVTGLLRRYHECYVETLVGGSAMIACSDCAASLRGNQDGLLGYTINCGTDELFVPKEILSWLAD
jgi:ankyrin repeat protein